ncbi:hypothetical protein FI667_g14379, partial [Globisporangium splendens]
MESPTSFAHLDADHASAAVRRESVVIGGEQASLELARSLPELIEELRRLRVEMEKSTKVYGAISSSQQQVKSSDVSSSATNGVSRDSSGMSNSTNRGSSGGGMPNSNSNTSNGNRSSYHYSMGGAGLAGRQSIFTPFADSMVDERSSIVTTGSPMDLGELSAPPMFRQMSAPVKRVQEQQQQQQQRMPRPAAVVVSRRRPVRIVDYTVMWVSGECGISLRNFSSNKIGAQIAVLQQANGVTTGISNCRLGDQLLSVNDDHVETMGFKDIVEKLKTTRRPITLGFRTNPNVATSPVSSSSSSSSVSRSSSGRFNSARTTNATASSGSSRQQHFFPPEDEAQDNAMGSSAYAAAPMRTSSNGSLKDDIDGCGADERTTDASVRSSTSTLSDEVEVWCKEQEEMHSDIIVLLTETVMRCEKLQQETMDQVSHWMQLANLGSS